MDARLCLSVSLLTLAMTFGGIFTQAQHWVLEFKASYEIADTTCYEHYTYSPACGPSATIAPLSLGLVPTVYACAARCQLMKGCRAFLFGNETSGGKGACRTYNVTVTSEAFCSEQTYTQGLLVTANCRPWWVMPCTTNTTCSGLHRACKDDHCSCEVGYLFESDSGNCVDVCVEYSDEFSVADATFFDTPVNITTHANNKKDCKAECLNYDCRSYQYRPSDDECILSNETVTTTPLAPTGHDGGSFLYLRECVVNL